MAKGDKKKRPVEEAPVAPPQAVKRSFKKATKSLEKQLRSAEAIYNIPWFAMVGEPGSGKGVMLGESGLAARPGSPETFGLEPEVANLWWFFNEAVVVDFDEDLFAVSEDVKGQSKAAPRPGLLKRIFKRKAQAPTGGNWRTQLDGLRDARRLRPLDGLVLTVDVGSLLMKTPEAAGRISRRAEAVASRIHEAQYQLAVDFPVYVVLTGCESLRGFDTFTRALPEQIRDQIFGWSAPYEPDTSYEPEWVEEAVASLHEQTCVAQVELLSQVPSQRDRDELYLLPREIRQLAEPLRLYLDPLFKTSTFRRNLPLRGIFLTGRVSDKRPPDPTPSPMALPPGVPPLPGTSKAEPPKGKPRYVRQLFSEKIFAEPGLAVIDEKRNRALNRKVRNARIGLALVLVLFGVFILMQRSFTGGEVAEFDGMLSILKSYQDRKGGNLTSVDQVKDEGVNALEALAQLDFDGFESLLAPTTLTQDLSTEVNQAIARVMGDAVGTPLANTLRNKAEIMLPSFLDNPPKNGQVDVAPDPTHIQPEAHFSALRKFVDEVNALELAFRRFQTANLTDIAQVYLYLTQKDITDKLVNQAGLYQQALSQMRSWPELEYDAPYGTRATNKLKLMVERMQTQLFRSHPLKDALDDLRRLLDTLKGGLGPLETHNDRLRAIREAITKVEELIHDGQAAWLLSETFEPGEGYGELLDKLNSEAFIQPEDGGTYSARVRSDNQRLFTDLREHIWSQRSVLGDFDLLTNREGRVVLSPALTSVKNALTDYFNQPYVISDSTQFELGLSRDAGARTIWNGDLINKVLSWERNFRSYVGGDRPGLSDAINEAIDIAARREFRNRVRDVMLKFASPQVLAATDDSVGSGGWTVQDRQRLKERITNIADLFDSLLKIVAVLDEVDKNLNEATDSRLFALLRNDVLDLLKQVDSILKSEKPYAIREDFDLSDSRLPPGVVAFGARDASDLVARLGVKRKTVQELAYEYARPLVDVMTKLGQPFASDPLVEKWSKIIRVLTDFDKKVPGNSLENLERFIEDDLNKVQLSTCVEQLKQHVNRYERDDLFKEAKYQIGSTMIRRCNEDLRKFTLQGYVDVQTFFTDRLAGRFPFAAADVIAEVETGDIVGFFQLFDKYAGAFKVFSRPGTSGGPIFGDATDEVLRFIQQVERMRPLFAPLITAEDENPDLVLDIEFEFRENRENEVNGNQIIEWFAQVADVRIGHRDNKRGTQWRTNDNVSVCFRWAKDAMFLPAVNQRSEAARVNGRTACYAYQGKFSLFRIISAHAATPADRGRRSFLRPHTLRFETETTLGNAPQDNASLLVTDTRVYIRLGLMLPGGKSAFRLPDFPRRAPEVSTEFLKAEGVRADRGGPDL